LKLASEELNDLNDQLFLDREQCMICKPRLQQPTIVQNTRARQQKRGLTESKHRPADLEILEVDPQIVWRRGRTRQTFAGPLQAGTEIFFLIKY
jgi:hypothetical protein